METPEEVLAREMELLKEDFIQAHKDLKMKASGNWEREIDDQVIDTTAKLTGRVVGVHYTTQLVKGRRPGKMPPSKAIEEWIRHKGIKAKGKNIKISQLAFAIAVNIKKKGTKYFQQGGTDLIDRVLTPERIKDIIDKVGDAVIKTQSDLNLSKVRQLMKVA